MQLRLLSGELVVMVVAVILVVVLLIVAVFYCAMITGSSRLLQ